MTANKKFVFAAICAHLRHLRMTHVTHDHRRSSCKLAIATMKNCILLTLLILALSSVGFAQDKPQLPDAPGKAVTQKLCNTCHGAEIVLGKPHSEDGWGAIVADMVQRGAKGSDEDFYDVVQYLTANIKALPKVKVNTATAKELEAGLRLSSAEAELIDQAREKAKFKTIADLKTIPGIEAKKIDAQKNRLEF